LVQFRGAVFYVRIGTPEPGKVIETHEHKGDFKEW
jgi:hypothetical protein